MQFRTGCLTLWIIAWLCLSGVVDCKLLGRRLSQDVLVRAVCRARCLKKYAQDVSRLAGMNDSYYQKLKVLLKKAPQALHQTCIKSHNSRLNCNECINKGCAVELRSAGNCQSLCQGSTYCLFGCTALIELLHTKPGQCPAPRRTESNDNCYSECSTDLQCGVALAKCCSRGCGRQCISPSPLSSFPPVVKKTKIFEVQGKRLEMLWPYNASTFLDPVLFVVQISYYNGRTFQWQQASKWATLFMNTGTRSTLEDLRLGVWYRFRIATVTAEGTRGFGSSTTPVHLSHLPKPPTAPRNVTDRVWRIHAPRTINVEITWSPPTSSDIPITAYSIRWVKDHGYVLSDGQSLEGLTKFKKNVPPDQLRCTIENLEPDTSYKVQVVALAQWGEEVLKSEANTLFITAPTTGAAQRGQNSPEPTVERPQSPEDGCRCGRESYRKGLASSEPARLHIYKPEFEKNSLNVRIILLGTRQGKDAPYAVEWQPEVCIAGSAGERSPGLTRGTMRARFFKIRGLDFNCRYSLFLTPLDPRPGETRIRSCFCTPSCRDVQLADPRSRPTCALDNSPPLPARPKNVKSRLVDVDRLDYLLQWDHPRRGFFNKYRVMWGPREEEPVNKDMYGDKYGLSPKLDFQSAEIKVIDKNITSLVLRNLRRATLYIVKVQSLSYHKGKERESSEAVHYFTTEGFTNPVNAYKTPGIVSKYIKQSPNPNPPRSGTTTTIQWTILQILPLFLTLLLRS